MFANSRRWMWIALALCVGSSSAWGQYGYNSEITALHFSPDGKTLYAACLDEKLHIYDVVSGKEAP